MNDQRIEYLNLTEEIYDETEYFSKWLSKLDYDTRSKIIEKINEPDTIKSIYRTYKTGNPCSIIGICKKEKNSPYNGNVFEIKITYPSAYRVYFVFRIRCEKIALLLLGGKKCKKSKQQRDIKKAYEIAARKLQVQE